MTSQPAITKEIIDGQLVLTGNAFTVTERYGTTYLNIGGREFDMEDPRVFQRLHVYAQNELGEETYEEKKERERREREYQRHQAEAEAAQRKAQDEAQATIDQMRAAFAATGKSKEELLAEMFQGA